MKIILKTKIPGPKAKKIIARDKQFVSPSYTRDPNCQLVVASGKGAYVEDVDGNIFLDFCAGIAVNSTGHCHPRIVEAIQEQAKTLIHMSGTDFYYDVQSRLAEKLANLAPGKEPKKVFFSNSGAEAIEAALKLSRYATGRKYFLAFYGSFHGRTYGALSLTASKTVQKHNFFPLVPGVVHIPYPNPSKHTSNNENECSEEVIDHIEKTVFKTLVPPEEVAAVFFEPIQGEGGYVVPPLKFPKELKKLCEKYGILLVTDEVQSGMGRTGKMFAIEHFGVVPDIICVAKGIASGLPLGATIARDSIMNWKPGSHASTFGGNPISSAASLATIELLEQQLIKNAAQQGAYILKKLGKLKEKFSIIVDVRGRGLMIGIEFISTELRNRIVTKAFHKGLVILGCGTTTIRFCPSLVITQEDADCALAVFEDCLSDE